MRSYNYSAPINRSFPPGPRRAGSLRRPVMAYQTLDPTRTPWHITWGTYGSRLHGGHRPTVDRVHNKLGEEFIGRDAWRERTTKTITNFPPITLTLEQRSCIETTLADICARGGWTYRICAAETDHVHLLCDVHPDTRGKQVRALAKRSVGDVLMAFWPLDQAATWWAEGGSNKAIHEERYLTNAYNYILRQRLTPL
jgi:REP element-mobilizing transposase RayT